MRVWVRERKPRTVAEVGKLADDFAQVRGQTKEEKHRSDEGRPEDGQQEGYHCCLVGHLAMECRNWGPYTSVDQRTKVLAGKRESVKYYNCRQQGHIASRCPSRVSLYKRMKIEENEGEERNERRGDPSN